MGSAASSLASRESNWFQDLLSRLWTIFNSPTDGDLRRRNKIKRRA